MSFWRAIWITLIFAVIHYLTYSILIIPKYFIDFKNNYPYFDVVINIFSQILSFLIIYKLFIKNYLLIDKQITISNKNLLILLLIAIGEIIFSVFTIDINDLIFSIPNNISDNHKYPPFLYFLLRIIKGCLVAPIVEELFFRNFIQKRLAEKYSNIFAILFSSLLFSIHHFDLKNVLPAFVLGIILGIVYQKSKNIKYSVYLHSISNFIIYTINFYFWKFDLFFINNKFNTNYCIIICIGAIILYFGLKLFGQNFKKEKTFQNDFKHYG